MSVAELKAGIELNRLIAEKVMGLVKSVNMGDYYGAREQGRNDNVFGFFKPLMDYSGYMGAAWEVMERMHEARFSQRDSFASDLQRIVSERHLEERFNDDLIAWPDVLFFLTPEIICLAALAAMESK